MAGIPDRALVVELVLPGVDVLTELDDVLVGLVRIFGLVAEEELTVDLDVVSVPWGFLVVVEVEVLVDDELLVLVEVDDVEVIVVVLVDELVVVLVEVLVEVLAVVLVEVLVVLVEAVEVEEIVLTVVVVVVVVVDDDDVEELVVEALHAVLAMPDSSPRAAMAFALSMRMLLTSFCSLPVLNP